MKYEDHELAAIFPLMSDAELASLADDIESNGLRDAVWLYEGRILDGRNRYRACQLKDVDPRIEEYRGKDPLGFVVSKNLHRRHLTESQRAMVAARIATARVGKPADMPDKQTTQSQAADLLGVGERTVRDAKTVQTHGTPELIAAVDAGEASVSAAAEVAKLPKAEQKKAVKDGTVAEKAKQQRKKKAKPAAPSAPSVPTSDGASADDADADEREPDEGGATVVQPTQVDAWGIPIQPHAAEAFAALPKFKELIAAIQHAQRLFNEVANLPGGQFLTLPDVSSFRRGRKGDDGEHANRFVHPGIETAYQQVKAAMPTHTVCPWNYVEAGHPDNCRTCKGLNWTPALGSNIPPAAIAGAKEAHGV